MSIGENIQKIKRQIGEFAEKSGRTADEILLVGVTKTRSAAEINEAIRAGLTDIGENKVQEILDKYDQVDGPVRWHMIGHLQRNKVKYIIDRVYMIHSVDSLRLAREIDSRAAQRSRTMDILIQVNVAGEESKFGVASEETGVLIEAVLRDCPHLRIRGLMSIAPAVEDPGEAGVWFRQVKEQYDRYGAIRHERLDFQYLSMGMSHDFGAAILEGANLVRIGTAIFGERNYAKQT